MHINSRHNAAVGNLKIIILSINWSTRGEIAEGKNIVSNDPRTIRTATKRPTNIYYIKKIIFISEWVT